MQGMQKLHWWDVLIYAFKWWRWFRQRPKCEGLMTGHNHKIAIERWLEKEPTDVCSRLEIEEDRDNCRP